MATAASYVPSAICFLDGNDCSSFIDFQILVISVTESHLSLLPFADRGLSDMWSQMALKILVGDTLNWFTFWVNSVYNVIVCQREMDCDFLRKSPGRGRILAVSLGILASIT